MTKRKSDGIQARHNKRRQQRIRQQKRRRCIFFSVLALIAILSVMLFAPFFNTKLVEVSGNSHLTSEEILAQAGDLTGRNLFRTGKSGIKKSVSTLAYIDKVSIKKKPFPPTILIEVEECQPVCQIDYSGTFILVDSAGKVLEKTSEKRDNVPVLEGVSIIAATPGELIGYKDEEMQKIVTTCVENMEKAGIIKDIKIMSFADITNITFNYQSRLDVICGTHIDFQRKLALFKEAVNSSKLTENSRGTINLSTTGKAIYTP